MDVYVWLVIPESYRSRLFSFFVRQNILLPSRRNLLVGSSFAPAPAPSDPIGAGRPTLLVASFPSFPLFFAIVLFLTTTTDADSNQTTSY